MSRKTRRKREQRREQVYGGLLIVLVILVVALVVIVRVGQRGGPDLDSANCPEDGGYAAQFAILVDPSDSLTSVQRLVVPRLLETIHLEAPETTEIRLYALAHAGRGEIAPVLRTCVPSHPDSVSALNSNPRIAKREYHEFTTELRDSLSAMISTRSDHISPILEGIQVASVDAFQPRLSDTPRQLLIVSDMLQNSSSMSFYRNEVDFGTLSRDPEFGTLRVDLTGVKVTVFLLARSGEAGRIQAGNVRSFWADYFVDQGAHSAARPNWVNVEG